MLGLQLLLCLVSCTYAAHITQASDLLAKPRVVDITTNNIDNILANNEIVVIKYYAKWCIRSNMMEKEFEQAARYLFFGSKVKFGQVDGVAEPKIRTRYNIGAYPLIQLHRKGLPPIIYKGRNDARGMINFVQRGLASMLEELKTAGALDSLLSTPLSDVVVLGYLPKANIRERYNFLEIARKLRDKIVFGIANSSAVLKHRFGTGIPDVGVLIYKKLEQTTVFYSSTSNSSDVFAGNFSIRSLSSWILENTKLVVNPVHPENILRYLEKPAALLFVDTLNDTASQLFLKIFYSAATALQHKTLNFMYTDGVLYKPFMERLGVLQMPGVVVIDVAKEEHYLFHLTLEFVYKNLVIFLNEVVAGTYSHVLYHSKSVVRSGVAHHGYIRADVITNGELDSNKLSMGSKVNLLAADEHSLVRVLQSIGKAALVYFHAPWCGFCKSTFPVLQKLATVIAAESLLLIEYDVSRSGLHLPVNMSIPNELPFILLFTDPLSTPIPYTESPSVVGLLNFINTRGASSQHTEPPYIDAKETVYTMP